MLTYLKRITRNIKQDYLFSINFKAKAALPVAPFLPVNT
jgi:hypothetical protein